MTMFVRKTRSFLMHWTTPFSLNMCLFAGRCEIFRSCKKECIIHIPYCTCTCCSITNTLWGVHSVPKFCFVFFRKFPFTVAAVSAQRPLEHVKNALQNTTNEWTLHSAWSKRRSITPFVSRNCDSPSLGWLLWRASGEQRWRCHWRHSCGARGVGARRGGRPSRWRGCVGHGRPGMLKIIWND